MGMVSAAWDRYRSYLFADRASGFSLDISRMHFSEADFRLYEGALYAALDEMSALEGGAIANADEGRMVGHYWLRNPALAPTPEIQGQIESNLQSIKSFVDRVHKGELKSPAGRSFKYVLVVGIGGSALGPQFVRAALGGPRDKLRLCFFDNTDPDGMYSVLGGIPDLAETLVVVISKSGGTKETRNGQLIARAAWQAAQLDFTKACVAVTQEGSELDRIAVREGWLARFPMWDWVGGRTSWWSAVGLLPAALQGLDIEALLGGAKEMDELTRCRNLRCNPAALMALMWYLCGRGRGEKDMVVIPYKDRLELFSRYLQQLVMESLGKREDRAGRIVHQGLVVYGNKGSTDQHAYVQQLRDGPNNFFVVFIEVLRDEVLSGLGEGVLVGFTPYTLEVEPQITAGDYLSGFYQGTRMALYESGRESVTITLNELTPAAVGRLIAFFERTVGLYAGLINVNAYHQPGVEAGKQAARRVLEIQKKVLENLSAATTGRKAEEIACAVGEVTETETVYKVLRHLAANRRISIREGQHPLEDLFGPLLR